MDLIGGQKHKYPVDHISGLAQICGSHVRTTQNSEDMNVPWVKTLAVNFVMKQIECNKQDGYTLYAK